MIDLPRHVKLERVAVTCPLGMRFCDVATGGWVAEGLVVEAYPESSFRSPPEVGASVNAGGGASRPVHRTRATFTRSGVAAFHGLPGLKKFEYGADSGGPWLDPLPGSSFRIEVFDLAGRFLPCTFLALAPARGLFGLATSSWSPSETAQSPPREATQTIPLFSSPIRAAPGGFAVLRAQLLRYPSRSPAAWTLVEVSTRVNNRIVNACGLSDERGVLALIFPYPEPPKVSLGSPLGGSPQLLSQQHWTLEFRAWHIFDTEPGKFADLDRVLMLSERPADLLWESDSPLIPFTHAELVFGRELIVPVRAHGDERPRTLLVTPAG